MRALVTYMCRCGTIENGLGVQKKITAEKMNGKIEITELGQDAVEK